MTGKKILTIAVIGIGGLMLFGFKKYNTAKEVLNNIEVGVKSISSIKISFKEIKFNAVLTLKNLTNIDFGATLTSKIIVKQIRVYNKENQYIGKAETVFYELDLPANSTVELPEVKVNLDLDKALNEFLNNPDTYLNQDFSNLNFKIDVEVFGNLLTLTA